MVGKKPLVQGLRWRVRYRGKLLAGEERESATFLGGANINV